VDFSNILAYPPAEFAGVVVLRLIDQAHITVEAAIRRVLDLLTEEPIGGTPWIVEDRRIAFVADCAPGTLGYASR
jgi:hypothetical protein